MSAPMQGNTDLDRVREASDIVDVIGEHVTLKPKGREFVCLCPFHDDHNPSMYVVPHKQIFNCFVCGAAGDVFTFVEKFHSMNFREALEFLAERSGVELTRTGINKQQNAGPGRAEIIGANDAACEFFCSFFHKHEGAKRAREIAQGRGISPEMIEKFRLGASPDRWDGLLMTMGRKGIPVDHLVAAGLVRQKDGGKTFDNFRNRLMFPIPAQVGRVVAFGARKINEEDEPKYLNSPDSAVFDKSSTLYGLHQAASAIRQSRVAIVTEGYTDVIACHQAGFENAIATLGTALTPGHAKILRRLCDAVILLFDADEAGLRAADRATEVFFSERLDVRVCTLSAVADAKDPDELLKREGGAEAFKRALDASVDLLEFRFARVKERLSGAGPAAVQRAIEEELPRLAELGLHRTDPVRKRLILQRLSSITGVPVGTLTASVSGGHRPSPAPAKGSDSLTPGLGGDPLRGPDGVHATMLGCLLANPALWAAATPEIREALRSRAYALPVLSSIANTLIGQAESTGSVRSAGVIDALRAEPGGVELATALRERVSTLAEEDQERVRSMWEGCVRRIESDRARTGSEPDIMARLQAHRRAQSAAGPDGTLVPKFGPGRGPGPGRGDP
ncbi:MAG: DNA primase [Phycisphaerales bacterium]|nr:DNA primase [Phycisphaerales bacterium]